MLFLGARTRAGFNAIREDDMYLYCVHETAEDDVPLDRVASHARLMDLLDEYGGLVAEVRDRFTPDRPLHYGPLYTTFVEGPWHRGRVVLIGDAAHATPPHLASGAGIAIEDAIVLAQCLRDEPTVPMRSRRSWTAATSAAGWSSRTRGPSRAGTSIRRLRAVRRRRS